MIADGTQLLLRRASGRRSCRASMIALIVLGLNSLGDGLRDIFDPQAAPVLMAPVTGAHASTAARARRPPDVSSIEDLTRRDPPAPRLDSPPSTTSRFDVGRGEIALHRRRERLRQDADGARAACACCRRRRGSPAGRVVLDGVDLAGAAASARCGGVRGDDVSMVFQEPMTSLDPSFTIGYQLVETFAGAPSRIDRAAARDRALPRCSSASGIPSAGAPARRLPAPVLRRHAPAGR